MASETQPPIELDKKRSVSMPFALLVSALVAATGAGIAWANLKTQVDEIPPLKTAVAAHAVALGKLDVMANDIQWIKAELLRRQHEENRRTP